MTKTDDRNEQEIAAVRVALEQWCDQVQQALGDTLQAVILYGGLAKGEFNPASSDVNVMVVLKQVTMAELDRVVPIVQQSVRDFRLAPLFLSERDLRRSTDVFPVKFLDMQRHHQVLRGRDVLVDLTIAQDHLRLRAEQQIKNLLLRLRLYYVRRSHRPELIESTLSGAISSLISSLAVLLLLKTGQTPTGKAQIADAAAQTFGLDGQLLQNVLALKARNYEPDDAELRRLYGDFMTAVEHTADVVDQL